MATIYTRNEFVTGASDRSFGIVMTAVFSLMSLINWWHQGRAWGWTIGIAAVFLAATLFHPSALKPLNQLWLKFGMLLHKVVNPIVMALVLCERSGRTRCGSNVSPKWRATGSSDARQGPRPNP